MEPTTLGNSASGGHDDSPFAKGYQAGFQHGWNQGFRRGKQEGRREAAPQTRSREGDDAAEGSEEAQGRHPRQHDQSVCLLSDAPLSEASSDASSIREEDVFHDAKSVVSASPSGSEESDLIDLFFDAQSEIVAPASDPGEEEETELPTSSTTRPPVPSDHASPSPEDLFDLLSDAGEEIPALSPGASHHDDTIVNLAAVVSAPPASSSAVVPKASTTEEATAAPAPIACAAHSNMAHDLVNITDDNLAPVAPTPLTSLSAAAATPSTTATTVAPAPIPGAAHNNEALVLVNIMDDDNLAALSPASPSSSSAVAPRPSPAEETTVAAPAPIPGAARNNNEVHTLVNIIDDNLPTIKANEDADTLTTTNEATSPLPTPIWPWNPRPPSLTISSLAGITTLHNIPLPPTITPRPPSPTTMSTLPPRRTRPPYPTLASPLHNADVLRAQGCTVVASPWRVLIGPLSETARSAWKADAGRKYLRGKLRRGVVGAAAAADFGRGGGFGGGFGGFGGGRGQGGSPWEGEDALQYFDTTGGLMFSELVLGEGEFWYVLVTFDAQDKARDAVATFAGYACGGSIMWAWAYQEAL